VRSFRAEDKLPAASSVGRVGVAARPRQAVVATAARRGSALQSFDSLGGGRDGAAQESSNQPARRPAALTSGHNRARAGAVPSPAVADDFGAR
jgi:hypothetical protein